MTVRDAVVDRYRAYLDACNRRAWDELRRFLAGTVVVNGRSRTPQEYVADIQATTK